MTGIGTDPGEWRLEGEGARFLGLPQSANPYPSHSLGGEIWAAGWVEADQIIGALLSDTGGAAQTDPAGISAVSPASPNPSRR